MADVGRRKKCGENARVLGTEPSRIEDVLVALDQVLVGIFLKDRQTRATVDVIRTARGHAGGGTDKRGEGEKPGKRWYVSGKSKEKIERAVGWNRRRIISALRAPAMKNNESTGAEPWFPGFAARNSATC